MEWNLFWTILAQAGIVLAAGVLGSFIIRLYLIWWPTSDDDGLTPEQYDDIVDQVAEATLEKVVFIGRQNDD